MSYLNRHPVRRATASVLAGTLALTGAALAAGVSPANAQAGFTFDRLQGVDRYGTAAAIALNGTTFDNSDTVVLASGATRNFPDALTGNYLAGEIDGPILLTDPNRLSAVTARAIGSLNVKKVVIVGGTSAVSAGVERQVNQLSDVAVQRIGGTDRYDTAELVAANVATGGQRAGGAVSATATVGVGIDPQGRRTAVLGNGQDFPDILAAGPLGYAEAFPITITRPTALPAQTRRTLVATGVKRVVIVGGTTAVSASVEAEVRALNGGIEIVRLAGVLRFETATKIADFAYDQLGFNQSHVNLARSDDFADALAGGPHGGEDRSPILITTPTVLNETTAAYLKLKACTLRNGHIFGGTAAISAAVKTAAETQARDTSGCSAAQIAAGSATPTGTINVKPDNAATVTATVNVDMTRTDDRVYFVDGLEQGETYRINQVLCENVRGEGGNATFRAVELTPGSGKFAVNTGVRNSDITRVNGAATVDPNSAAPFEVPTVTFVAATSVASFVIDGDGAECIVPVVYFNNDTRDTTKGGDSPRLELVGGPTGSFQRPSEEFDTGGRTTFVVG